MRLLYAVSQKWVRPLHPAWKIKLASRQWNVCCTPACCVKHWSTWPGHKHWSTWPGHKHWSTWPGHKHWSTWPGHISLQRPHTCIGFWRLLLFVGCLPSQQQASVSQGRICSDNFTCCHTEIEVADQTFYLTQSQYTDTGPTSPSADPITPDAWQGSHWSANF